ncbi:MAG: hypothetical protein ACUVXA_02750 [Candidatus Jordarchaeum sp.]|uniref:hypothetical protein n=1 Tax=Candidatus Jordarchaeum sp. TaxID=2823881 RepID=UPI00404AB31C
MHFLTKLVNNQVDDTVHRKFIKFSTGEFAGPTINIGVKKKSIDFKASFEYQDFVLEFLINSAPNMECTISGNIFSSEDVSEELEKLGIKLKKTKTTYKAAVKTSVSSEKLRGVYADIRDKSTFLISIKPGSGSWKLAMKANFPKPMAEAKDPTGFCKGTIERSENILQRLIEELAPDFKKEISLPFESLSLSNMYRIDEIVFPENKDKLSPREVRLQSKRKGTLIRILEVDGNKFEKEIGFIA